jgi:hypothetical protein
MKERDYGFLLLGVGLIDLFITYMLRMNLLTPHDVLKDWADYMASNVQLGIVIIVLIYSIYLIKKEN